MDAVIFAGLQGAGKSTFYREHFFRTHVRISLDLLRTRRREDALLRCCLEIGQRFVIDNTNPTIAERARYIAAAREFHFRVIGYFFATDVQTCLARNEHRSRRERVPPRGVLGTAKRFQIPTLQEGFDALYVVRITEAGDMLLEEVRDPAPQPAESESP